MPKRFQNPGEESKIKRNIELKRLDEYLVESAIPPKDITSQSNSKQVWPNFNDAPAYDSFYNSLDMDMFN